MSQKTERLVNLTIALLETRRPVAFAEIQRKTGYYTGQDHDAARRMFERDKDDLRSMGVPIDTLPIAYSDDVGYIINRKRYELADPSFTREEITALAVAQQQSDNAGLRLAFAKIAARAPDPDTSIPLPNFALRVTDSLYPPEVLAQAVVQRITVQFTYQTPNAAAAVRTVDPYALARRRSRWYLIGYDHQRDGIRAFRLDRVDGNVTHISAVAAFDPPITLDLAAELIPPIDDVHTISGDVDAEFAAQITARGGEVRVPSHALPHDRLPFTLPAVDLVRDVPWLLAFGPALRVHSPQPVVDAMRASLHAVSVANGPAS